MRRQSSRDIRQRFEAKVDKSGDCWIWTAYRNAKGYGWFRVRGHAQLAHRVAYRLYVGEIPDGLCVCHTCDMPACVRPAHLWLGTQGDNGRDMTAKGRRVRGAFSHRARLTEQTVALIRQRWDAGVSLTAIAGEFGLDDGYASRIARGKYWAHTYNGSGEHRPAPRVVRNARAKFTDADVREIRRRYAEGELQVAISRRFGVSQPTISALILRKTWAHVS